MSCVVCRVRTRLGETIRSEADAERLREDFCRIRSVVRDFASAQRAQSTAEAAATRLDEDQRGRATPEADDDHRHHINPIITTATDDDGDEAALNSPPFEDEELGRYQAAFLRLFARDLSPEQLLHQLRTQPEFAPFQSTSSPPMCAVRAATCRACRAVARVRPGLTTRRQSTWRGSTCGAWRWPRSWCASGCASLGQRCASPDGDGRDPTAKAKTTMKKMMKKTRKEPMMASATCTSLQKLMSDVVGGMVIT